MPWGETVSDFVVGQMGRQRQRGLDEEARKQAFFDNLMRVAGMGKDIWQTLQTHQWGQESLQPGSPEEQAAKRQIDYRLSAELEKDQKWQLFKIANPEKPVEVWYSTPDGQAFLDDQARRARELNDYQTQNRIKEIKAEQAARGISQPTLDIYDKAIKAAQEKFFTIDPATQGIIWKPGFTKKDVDDFLSTWLYSAGNEQSYLKKMFDAWSNDPYWTGQKPIVNNFQTPVDYNELLKSINDLVKKVRTENPNVNLEDIPVKSGTEYLDQPSLGGLSLGAFAGPLAGFGAQKIANKENRDKVTRAITDLQNMIPQLNPADRKIAEGSIVTLKNEGMSDKWKAIFAAVQALKDKYMGRSILEKKRGQ